MSVYIKGVPLGGGAVKLTKNISKLYVQNSIIYPQSKEEYEQLEWLASNSRSIIDTGIPGGKDTYRIEFETSRESTPGEEGANDVAYFGNWPSLRVDTEWDYCYPDEADTDVNVICLKGLNPKAAWWWYPANNAKNLAEIKNWQDGYYPITLTHSEISGMHEAETPISYALNPEKGRENLENIILYDFGLHARAPHGGDYYHNGGVSFKSFKIYDEDTLILDLIPVRNKQTQELGMYDRVKRKFLIDADPEAKGSGFVAGPIIGDLQ